MIEELKEKQISNILALRGDIPQNADFPLPNQYRHASELIADIKAQGDFCIGGACYPEGHPEADTIFEDLDHLKEKVDAGCEFLTTQMFLITTFCIISCTRRSQEALMCRWLRESCR